MSFRQIESIIMKIRSYSKSELAMLYFPDADSHTATIRLMRWIRRCPELRDRLAGCHSSKFAKFFTAKEVRLIQEYMGEP